MSTPTQTRPTLTPGRLTFFGLVRSEFIKLRTVRSTIWCYALIVLLHGAVSVLASVSSLAVANMGDSVGGPQLQMGGELSGMYAHSIAISATTLTQLIAAVLGVLVIGGEYATGMIRSTIIAAPRRIGVFLAKGLVLAVTTFIVGLVAAALGVVIMLAFSGPLGISTDGIIGDLARPVVGSAGFLALVALLAFAIGAIVRNTAGGLTVTLALLLVIPTVASLLATLSNLDWVADAIAFLPSSAGTEMFAYSGPEPTFATGGMGGMESQMHAPFQLDALGGTVTLLVWDAVLLALAGVLLKSRDV